MVVTFFNNTPRVYNLDFAKSILRSKNSQTPKWSQKQSNKIEKGKVRKRNKLTNDKESRPLAEGKPARSRFKSSNKAIGREQ